MKKKIIFLLLIVFLTLPVAVFGASQSCPGGSCDSWVGRIMDRVGKPVWQLLAGLAVIMFIVSGIFFATSNGEPGKVTLAKNAAIWGIVGIVVASVAFIIVQTIASWV